jgi:hypothetical protein
MRFAFHPETGPLTDAEAPSGERQALMELFSGAFGHARNPLSHRAITIERATAARLSNQASGIPRRQFWPIASIARRYIQSPRH